MKHLLFGVMALAMAATLTACPRDKGAGDTNAKQPPISQRTIDENTPPKTDASTPPADQAATNPDGTPVTPESTNPAGTPATNPDGTPATPPADGSATTPPADGSTTPPADAGTTPKTEAPAPGTTKVVLETTKGKIVLEVHPEWAPLGAAHFLELVNLKYYDGAPWFRVMDGFVAQCGVSGNEKLTAEWMQKTILDEPVKQGNVPGMVAFGKSGAPNSRSTHIFINLADNTGSLDPQGFSCFAKVTEGMDIALKLFKCEYQDQAGLAAPGGVDAFKKAFPEADFITKAYVQK